MDSFTTTPEIVYISCNPQSLINYVCIGKLVDQLLDELSIKAPFNQEEFFVYCSILKQRLGKYKTFIRSFKMGVAKEAKQIENDILACLPHRDSQISTLFSKPAKEIRRLFEMDAADVFDGHYRLTLAQVIFLVIMMDGKNLNISLCRLSVIARRENNQQDNFSWENCTIYNDYDEMQYTLSNSIIEEIASKIKAQAQLQISLLKERLFNPSVDNHRIAFTNCFHNSLLFDQEIMAIVTYAMGEMQIPFSPTHGITPTYQKYCTELGTGLGPYEPYSQRVSLKGCVTQNKSDIHKGIESCFPQFTNEFNQILSTAAGHVAPIFEMDDGKFVEHFRDESKELVVAEFTVLKIAKAGENLEIRPSNLKLKVRRSKVPKYFRTTTELETEMEYEERTYILDKFEIIRICQQLQQTGRRALPPAQIPSINEQDIYQSESEMVMECEN